MACVDAHRRGIDPATLEYEIVGDLQGARMALRAGCEVPGLLRKVAAPNVPLLVSRKAYSPFPLPSTKPKFSE